MKHLALLTLIISSLFVGCKSSKKQVEMKETQTTAEVVPAHDTAVLGGGCFWCIEAIFDSLKGVDQVTSGYAGGTTENPTYKEVCTQNEGHVEVIKIDYNPRIITYEELLDIFWHVHDPTTLNQQGNDIGEQYRSVIYYKDAQQKTKAEQSLASSEQSQLWGNKKYTTTIEPLPTFYDAEEYHQNYYENNPTQPYCSAVVGPKVQKFREKYKDKLK